MAERPRKEVTKNRKKEELGTREVVERGYFREERERERSFRERGGGGGGGGGRFERGRER